MIQFIPAIIILPLVIFYLWMFRDMVNNDDIPSRSATPLRWPPESKTDWAIMFVILNLVTAGYYYFTVYQEK